jgi:hypothetical protein
MSITPPAGAVSIMVVSSCFVLHCQSYLFSARRPGPADPLRPCSPVTMDSHKRPECEGAGTPPEAKARCLASSEIEIDPRYVFSSSELMLCRSSSVSFFADWCLRFSSIVSVFIKKAADITVDKNWKKVSMLAVPGMEKLDIRVHRSYFEETDDDDAAKLIEFFHFWSRFMMRLGGAIPLIVNGTLSDDDWKEELERGVHNPLDVDGLVKLTACVEGIPIYLFGQNEDVCHVDLGCEGNMTLTLAPTDFDNGGDRPNFQGTRMLIFVEDLQKVASAVEICSKARADMNLVLADFIIGRARGGCHELVHGMRIAASIARVKDSLGWIRNDRGDWCITLKDASDKLSTPPKLSEETMGRKKNNVLRADAGRTWELSITEGKAIFEGNFRFIIALKSPDDFALNIIPQKLTKTELFDVIEDPFRLIGISRAKADQVFRSKDPDGCRAARYVANSDAVVKYQFQCQSSMAWRANQVLIAQQGHI